MHINPYQLQTIDVEDETYFQVGDWHDSLAFEGGEDARVRMSVDTFTGKMILHCHILEHEDEGMMAVYDVRGDEGDVVSQAEALDLTCYRNSDRGYAYAAGGATRTYAPSYQPTPKPNYAPTASPSTNACADDDAWRKSNAPAKDCAWVAALPESRCAVKGDGVWAWRACRESCATCDYGCASGVGDDAGWRKNGAADKDCAWVSSFSYSGRPSSATTAAWPTRPARAVDAPSKDCAWVANSEARCAAKAGAKGADGSWAYDACPAACGICA
ncbi:ATPase [Aureococcus anophagefferens]|nr:ATPase [Aureococcus anophagefferens]